MKLRISQIFVLVGLMISGYVVAEEQWWSYLSGQESGPSSTRVDLSFNKLAPVSDYPFVVVTGITYEKQNAEGLPSPSQVDSLNAFQESLVAYLESKIPIKYAGTFTYQNEQLHYIYVQNKEKAEQAINSFYSTSCQGCKPCINVKLDPEWAGYKNFLYPSKQIIEYYGLVINE
ncbi:DUF695 domain-containing protein [Glaciecola sp. MF2-115]|uniref:DUF695 domain-containing protein n=1 Tax=Glaciecola sp. MF2-115 TaxID=3384827 RepID=UPI00399F87D6